LPGLATSQVGLSLVLGAKNAERVGACLERIPTKHLRELELAPPPECVCGLPARPSSIPCRAWCRSPLSTCASWSWRRRQSACAACLPAPLQSPSWPVAACKHLCKLKLAPPPACIRGLPAPPLGPW